MDSKKLKQLLPLIVGAVFLLLTILMPVFAKNALLESDDAKGGIWAVWLSILFGLVGFTAIMLYFNQVGHARHGSSFKLSGGLLVVVGGAFTSWFYALLVRSSQFIGRLYKEAGGKSVIKEYMSEIKAMLKAEGVNYFAERTWSIILLILSLLILALGLYCVVNALQGKQIDLLKKLGLHKALGSVGKTTGASAPATGTKFCRQCGATVAPNAAFCNSCGASLKDDAQ